ncbi:hypothetical protein HK102_005658, partial [Quaeritorhiza haematococci]
MRLNDERKQLQLMDNKISGGLEALTEAELNNLTYLDLSNNRIADLELLKPLVDLPALKHLNLLQCDISKSADYRSAVFGLLPDIVSLDDLDRDGNELEYSTEDDDEDVEEEEEQEEEEEEEEEDEEEEGVEEEDEEQEEEEEEDVGEEEQEEEVDDEEEDEVGSKGQKGVARQGGYAGEEDQEEEDDDEEEEEEDVEEAGAGPRHTGADVDEETSHTIASDSDEDEDDEEDDDDSDVDDEPRLAGKGPASKGVPKKGPRKGPSKGVPRKGPSKGVPSKRIPTSTSQATYSDEEVEEYSEEDDDDDNDEL